MIFLSVGTHEQPFNRLVEKVDILKKEDKIKENIIMQVGYSTYLPRFCTYSRFFEYDKMLSYMRKSRINIVHGGPSSIIMSLQEKKVPIVVPRKKEFNEHINNHQVEFTEQIDNKMNNIIRVNDIDNLYYAIKNYDLLIKQKNNGEKSNNINFNKKLDKIISDLLM